MKRCDAYIITLLVQKIYKSESEVLWFLNVFRLFSLQTEDGKMNSAAHIFSYFIRKWRTVESYVLASSLGRMRVINVDCWHLKPVLFTD